MEGAFSDVPLPPPPFLRSSPVPLSVRLVCRSRYRPMAYATSLRLYSVGRVVSNFRGLLLSLPFPSALLGCSGVLAIVEENGLEEILVGVCRLLGEILGETPTGLLSSSGLIDLLSPNIQEVVMLLLGYSACLLIVQYGALLTRASGRATRRPTTAWCGGMSPLPPPAGAPRTAPSTRRGTKLQTPCT